LLHFLDPIRGSQGRWFRSSIIQKVRKPKSIRGDGNIGDISRTRERFENENSKMSDQDKDSTLQREDENKENNYTMIKEQMKTK